LNLHLICDRKTKAAKHCAQKYSKKHYEGEWKTEYAINLNKLLLYWKTNHPEPYNCIKLCSFKKE